MVSKASVFISISIFITINSRNGFSWNVQLRGLGAWIIPRARRFRCSSCFRPLLPCSEIVPWHICLWGTCFLVRNGGRVFLCAYPFVYIMDWSYMYVCFLMTLVRFWCFLIVSYLSSCLILFKTKEHLYESICTGKGKNSGIILASEFIDIEGLIVEI